MKITLGGTYKTKSATGKGIHLKVVGANMYSSWHEPYYLVELDAGMVLMLPVDGSGELDPKAFEECQVDEYAEAVTMSKVAIEEEKNRRQLAQLEAVEKQAKEVDALIHQANHGNSRAERRKAAKILGKKGIKY